MATHTYACLDLPQAERLADLTSIKHDLESAKELAVRFSNQLENERWDSVLLDALSTTMLVRYSRAFAKGVRHKVKLDIQAILNDEQASNHDRLIFWRDKHIAHSVNAFEESQPIARFCLEKLKDEGVYGIECNHARVTSVSDTESRMVVELADLFIAFIELEIIDEKKKLLPLARAIPIDNLVLPSRQRPMLTNKEKIDKSRKK